MKALVALVLFFSLCGEATAQRRGGGGFGGRIGGGGHVAVGHGGYSGRIGGGAYVHGGAFRGYGGFGYYHGGYRGSRVVAGFGYWPYGWGIGAGFYSGYYGWPGYYDSGWPYAGYAGYPTYAAYPSVNVVYPAPAAPAPATTIYIERQQAHPVMREYDEYGQERPPAAETPASPIYLIAFRDGIIRAAVAYWVDGDTLHYVTREKEQKTVKLDQIDRALTLQLNRERRIPFQLP